MCLYNNLYAIISSTANQLSKDHLTRFMQMCLWIFNNNNVTNFCS